MWREFVGSEPDPAEVKRIAALFRGRDYDVKAALRALLLTDAFWAADQRGTLVKCPVELVVGTLRTFGLRPEAMPFAVGFGAHGPEPVFPAEREGLARRRRVDQSATLLARKQFLDRIVRMDGAPAPMMAMAAGPTVPARAAVDAGMRAADERTPAASSAEDEDKARARRFAQRVEAGLRNLDFDAAQWVARRPGDTPSAKMMSAQQLLLPLPPVAADPPRPDADAVTFVRAALLDPAYQLK